MIEALYRANQFGNTINSFDNDVLIAEFYNFFFAGTESLAYHLSILLLYVSKNAQIKQKMQEEIDRLFPTD